MEEGAGVSLERHLELVSDPRVRGRVQYPLRELIIMAVCAVIAGADNWVEVAQWSAEHLGWLQARLKLAVPSAPAHDTFGRVFSLLAPDTLQAALQGWLAGITKPPAGEVVAIDGKHLRHSYDTWQELAAVQVVNAWACSQHLMVAQVTVEPSSNELTAVPRLLEQLLLQGCIVTLDALHTHVPLAQQLVDQGADYVLPVKDNQPRLAADVASLFAYADGCGFNEVSHSYFETVAKGHGRIETRQCWAIDAPDFLAILTTPAPWPQLAAIVRLRCERRIGAERTTHERFFITSLPAQARPLLAAIRAHWQVENQLHWVLDVVFGEDDSRIRTGLAPHNFALLRRLALSLLDRDTHTKGGVQLKRKKAAWNSDYLLSLIHF